MMKLQILVILFTVLLTPTARAAGPAPDDLTAIKTAALDYGEGWYEGDAERMERALHPELAKRMIYTDPTTGKSRLSDMGAMTLVYRTRAGGGTKATVEKKESEAVILDVFENAAVVKVVGPEWVDYLQLAKWNGEWLIVNVLWELNPESREKMAKRSSGKK
jgi:hypothetical protein